MTLVFLQQIYHDQLPDLASLAFLDQVNVVDYVVKLATFVLVLWIARGYAIIESIEDAWLLITVLTCRWWL